MKTCLLLLALSFGVSAGHAAILPGVIGPWKQISAEPLPAEGDAALWNEYGLQESARGQYGHTGKTIAVEAWRLADSTASLGVFEFLRPADAKPAPKFHDLTPEAALTSSGALVALGNYVVRFTGAVPDAEAVANMFRSMARYENSRLPYFTNYLPDNAIANSERYVGGPVALKTFFPGVEPSLAGFRLGGEATIADYKPDLKLALFSYPTPAIARKQEKDLARIPGAVVKRTGPLVAIVLHPRDPNAAERLLSDIRYQAVVTTGEKPPTPKDNPGNLLLNVFYLIMILMGFCLVSGLVFGGIRMVFRRSGPSGEGEEILALHLEGR